MNAKELISELQGLIDRHGDVPVTFGGMEINPLITHNGTRIDIATHLSTAASMKEWAGRTLRRHTDEATRDLQMAAQEIIADAMQRLEDEVADIMAAAIDGDRPAAR